MIEKLRHPWRQNFQAALYFQLFFKMSEKFADSDSVDNSIIDQEQRDVKRLQIRSLLRGAEGVLGRPSAPPPPSPCDNQQHNTNKICETGTE